MLLKKSKKCFPAIMILILTFVLCVTYADAGPFLVCDPKPGIESYKIEVPIQHDMAGHYERVLPAETDGSLKMDLGIDWPYKDGKTYNCKAYNGGTWKVKETSTGIETMSFEWGPSADFEVTSPAAYSVPTGIATEEEQ